MAHINRCVEMKQSAAEQIGPKRGQSRGRAGVERRQSEGRAKAERRQSEGRAGARAGEGESDGKVEQSGAKQMASGIVRYRFEQ